MLNPCYHGCISPALYIKVKRAIVRFVLILVIMDVSLPRFIIILKTFKISLNPCYHGCISPA